MGWKILSLSRYSPFHFSKPNRHCLPHLPGDGLVRGKASWKYDPKSLERFISNALIPIEMDNNLIDQTDEKWKKADNLLVDLPSFESGFHVRLEREKYRKEIWDYLQYRESLLKWPSTNEKGNDGIEPE